MRYYFMANTLKTRFSNFQYLNNKFSYSILILIVENSMMIAYPATAKCEVLSGD